MLKLYGRKRRFCDGVSRRDFLHIGAAGALGLALPAVLRAEAVAGARASGKSLINIFLGGGPSHLDTFDLKPNAPKEFRGDFRPIATKAPGLEICEHMPRLASVGDKFAVIRSIVGMYNEHDHWQSDTGWSINSLKSIGGRPSIGSVMSKLIGPANGSAPMAVDLTGSTNPGFLGSVNRSFRPDNIGRDNLTLSRNMTLDRLGNRRELLGGLDRLRREVDGSGAMTAIDSFTSRAIDIVTSGELATALDIKQEDPRNIERYGISQRRDNERFLMARRLVEAGVRSVSFSWGGWDTHGNNFGHLSKQLPALDSGLGTLIEDLAARGRLDDTMIMMSGEFGRTPRINGGAGRDHWPRAAFFFIAGGGLRTGQAIGSTNRLGEQAQERPIHYQQLFATVYKNLGIDIDGTTLTDPNGRPQYLLDHREPIAELI